MPQKTRFFRVAVEGATTDGRNIERAWIEQMARTYDPKTYGARVWMEHIRGLYADSEFRAYGDVTALKAEEVDIGGKKKLALFAEIAPLPDLVKMTADKKQKIYTSIEINPKFGDSGQAYLVGLAVTDSPASLGTEILEFAAKHPQASPFKARKKDPENMFSEAIEADIELDDDEDEADPPITKAFSALKKKVETFSKRFRRAESADQDVVALLGEITEVVEDLADEQQGADKRFSKLEKELQALSKASKELQEKFKTIDTTDGSRFTSRPPATGGDPKAVLTDC